MFYTNGHLGRIIYWFVLVLSLQLPIHRNTKYQTMQQINGEDDCFTHQTVF